MGRTPLNNTAEIVALSAAGESQRAIAKALGCSTPTVNSRLKKSEVKALVERISQEIIIQSAGLLVGNHIKCLKKAGKIYERLETEPSPGVHVDPKTGKASRIEELSESEKAILALADKKEGRIGQTMGIFPSHAPSVLIQNIFQAGSAAVLLPNVAAALGQAGIQFQVEPEPAGDEEDGVIDVGDE